MGMKGHPESNCRGGGGGWMKKKTVVVAVVIFVALMGVMVAQKVKDTRLFNRVVKEKDRQILTLQLLLQKERQYAKENKKKYQDLSAKLYSLGTQKIELGNKIMEMRSIIGSLRDEQRVLELAIEEKQSQIKHRESEIKDLKSSLQTPPKIWSVSSDDPSNGTVNLTDVKVKVQNPKDEKLAGLEEHKDDAKIEMHNVTYRQNDGQNGNGLSQRSKSLIAETDGQHEASQLKADADEGQPEVTPFKSKNHSTNELHHKANETKSEVDRLNEDEAETDTETEADSDSSKNVSEADQDYREEAEQ